MFLSNVDITIPTKPYYTSYTVKYSYHFEVSEEYITEVLGENISQRHFVHHKSHLIRPGIEPGPPRWEASD
jgi:hypothetical protein